MSNLWRGGASSLIFVLTGATQLNFDIVQVGHKEECVDRVIVSEDDTASVFALLESSQDVGSIILTIACDVLLVASKD